MSAERSSRLLAIGAAQKQASKELLAPKANNLLCRVLSLQAGNKANNDVCLQLEIAAKEFVRRFAKQDQDGEEQPVADLQVFLHSSAHFGPVGMRELVVGKPVLLLL